MDRVTRSQPGVDVKQVACRQHIFLRDGEHLRNQRGGRANCCAGILKTEPARANMKNLLKHLGARDTIQRAISNRTMRRLLMRVRTGNLRLLLNLIHLGEVYYRLIQLVGEKRADELLGILRSTEIEVVPLKEPLVLEAARIKARHPLSYADAFAVATARLEKAPVVTGDPEILALPRQIVKVRRLGGPGHILAVLLSGR